jgi:methyl-accepting chemotaxis protein
VRSLAHRSAAAAKEIKALIDESVQKVDTGSVLVAQAGSTMGEIVKSVKRVTDIMGEIMAANHEQSMGITQINGAVNEMDHVTQQNAALVEEAAAATEALKIEANHLSEAVSAFKVEDTLAC